METNQYQLNDYVLSFIQLYGMIYVVTNYLSIREEYYSKYST